MPEQVIRQTLLQQALEDTVTSSVEIRRITLQPDVVGGAHFHNGAVFGSIERGSVVFQVDGGPEVVLHAGDVFYEPAHTTIDRFDALADGVTFLGYFLSTPGEQPELSPVL